MKTQTAIKIAATFFGIGTFIFIGHYFAPEAPIWFMLGFVFMLLATLINSVLVLLNIIKLIKYDQLETFFSICILLLNIPVAAVYIYFALLKF